MDSAPTSPSRGPSPSATAASVASDLLAGVAVFLVALPLCLGIALASDAPPIAGIVAGVIAGIVVGNLGGSPVMISGPAAGLTAVVAAEIAAIGSFEGLLLAVVLAGAMQVVAGLARGGFLKSFVPTSVVRGLLSAIGVILVLKQVPHLLGHDADPEGEMSFLQPDRLNTFSELLEIFSDLHPGAAVLGVLSLAIVLAWNRIPIRGLAKVPSPLVVVALGIAGSFVLATFGEPWAIGPTHRVQLPIAESAKDVLGFFHVPDFSLIGTSAVWSAALVIAAVASLQALLTSEAVDRLDPQRRATDADRELVAQGVANCVCGLVGGLPVTGEIVRSSVNVDSGGQSRLASVSHGVLLAAALLLVPSMINLVPLSSLAAVLIGTGVRLASPAVFRGAWQAGRSQFVPYIVTLVSIVLTDPLVGIGVGLVAAAGFILSSNLRRPMRQIVEHHLAGEVTRIELANQVSFLNRAAIRAALDAVPAGTHVLLDGQETVYVDPDIQDLIREYRDVIGPARGVRVSTSGFREKYPIGNRIEFVDFTSRELQEHLTPAGALEYLLAGNERFRSGRRLKRNLGRQLVATAEGQFPVAVVLSCIDSRSPAELLFDLGLGDVFSVRVAGNVATPEVLGSIEFACAVAGAKLVVVLGHTRCGAVNAAVRSVCEPGVDVAPGCTHLGGIVAGIRHSIDGDTCGAWRGDDPAGRPTIADGVARRNVAHVVDEVLQQSTVLRRLVEDGRAGIVGMMYDVATGRTEVIDGSSAGVGPLPQG